MAFSALTFGNGKLSKVGVHVNAAMPYTSASITSRVKRCHPRNTVGRKRHKDDDEDKNDKVEQMASSAALECRENET